MDYRVDEKGKVFTTRVTKQSIAITARVGDSIIQGMIHIQPDNRLKDELNHGEDFIAITDAQVSSLNSANPIHASPILIVNKAHIHWLFPRDESLSKTETRK